MLRPQFTKRAGFGRSRITGLREPVQSNVTGYLRTFLSYVRGLGGALPRCFSGCCAVIALSLLHPCRRVDRVLGW